MQQNLPYSSTREKIKHHWFWDAVLTPYLIIRFALLVVIYFSQMFSSTPEKMNLNWGFHIKSFLLSWARWDSAWYLSIIKEGYHVDGPITQVQSNISFFPLYPYLVKIISWPVYYFYRKDAVLILFGVLISNIFLLAALFLFYKLIQLVFNDSQLAKRSILYLLVFPSAFIFSCMYTESTFLFFVIASFYFALKRRWILAAVMGAVLSLARPTGVFVVIPLGIIYLESIKWKLPKIRPDILWLGLVPLPFFAFMGILYPLTGDFLAVLHSHAAWHHYLTDPITALLNPPWTGYSRGIYEIDHISLIVFILLSILALVKLPSLSFGVYPLLVLVPLLFNGILCSINRYCLAFFPIFILFAMFGKNELVHKVILALFFSLQIIFILAWTLSYWVQ